MTNLLRQYAIASFVGVLVAAVLLAGFYRHIEIHETVEFAQKSNLSLAEAVLDSARPELGEYLNSATGMGPREISDLPLPRELALVITELMKKTSIAKVRIYNDRGVIAYSSDRQEIGRVDTANSGLASASKGEAVSEITYRDAFSVLDRRTDEDNLVRTFVPVRPGSEHSVRGALATYVDLSAGVAQTEQEVVRVTGGVTLILMLLYATLLFVVMRAQKVIEAQQVTIRERTASLETLSVQLLAGEEAEKLNLAHNLHEGLAQTLTAIKIGIENGLERMPSGVARDSSLNTALESLQGAIDEVQEMAAELRPSSLDELGLLPTINWLCREFESLHPDIRIEQQVSLLEREIPEQLKIVIFRIIEAVLKDIGNNPHQDRVRLCLQPNAQAILLSIDDIPQDSIHGAAALDRETPNPRLRFAGAQERATLSGGAFSAAFNREGGITLHASWAMQTGA